MKNELNKKLLEVMHTYVPKISICSWVGDEIPHQKLQVAIDTYAQGVDPAQVLAMIDTTVTGSCKEGILFTTSAMYVSLFLSTSVSCKYQEIASTKVSGAYKINSLTHSMSEVKDCKRKLHIQCKNDDEVIIEDETLNKTPFEKLISEIILLQETYEFNDDKYIIIQDVDDDIKLAYISIISNFSNLTTPINAQQLNRLYALMVRIKTSPEIRKTVLQQLDKSENIDTLVSILETSACANKSALKAVYISMIKDLLLVSGIKYNQFDNAQNEFIKKILNHADLGKEEIDIIQTSIIKEQDFILGKISEKEYISALNNISAGAAALGLPVAALYLSGSVVGLSAAGITSGLAALGLGGILGLSSMVTGLGVLVALGGIAYHGVKKASESGKQKNISQREILLKAAAKANENVISALISDINYIINELVTLAEQNEINAERIKRLSIKIQILKQAFEQSAEKHQENEDSIALIEVENE